MYADAAPFFYDKGCDLTVMATADDLGEFATNFEKAGYSILHLKMPPLNHYFKRILYYKSTIELLKINNYDVVHIHASKAMWGFAFCSWLSNTQSVYTFHNVFPTNFYSYLYHVFLRVTSKYLFKCRFHTISDSVYNHEKSLYFNNTEKIYNWYSDKRYYPATDNEKQIIRKELKLQRDTLVLISVGGCSSIKRHSDILKALKVILDKFPNTIYLHLGKGDLECEEQILAQNLGISENVIFCNNQQDVRKYLIASDIYIMPSKFEGIPITTIEAMACGIPAILYDVPGLRDFNKNGENCLLIQEDFILLAEMVIYLKCNSEKACEISMSAKNFVRRNFDLSKNVSKIIQLYNRI